ncbi:MAG: hypothetical protein KAU02_02580 [Tenericutes bacterium]|nr:hypothetical protein [Mycoplasmatota bacterium]
MKKVLLIFAVVFLTFGLTSCDIFGINETTTVDPASITTVDYDNFIEVDSVDELIAMEMNKSYKLMSDLDLADIEWEPIGTLSSPFLGNFDGDGYTISNMEIVEDYTHNGLFGYIEGDVFDLNLTNISIDFEAIFIAYVGGVAGFSDGAISNCEVSGNIVVSNENYSSYIGMLVGFTQGKLDRETLISEFEPNVIDNNTSDGIITVVSEELGFVGGLIGKTYNTTVSNNVSYTELDVTAGIYPVFIGGLIGHNYGGILIGFNEVTEETSIYIENNIAKNTITLTPAFGNVSVGGFIGYNNKGYNRDNYVEANIIIGELNIAEDKPIKLGGYFGEAWKTQVKDVIVNSTFTNDNISYLMFPEFVEGALVGGDYLEYPPENIYVVTPTAFDTTGLQTKTATEILEPNFIAGLGWESDFLSELE